MRGREERFARLESYVLREAVLGLGLEAGSKPPGRRSSAQTARDGGRLRVSMRLLCAVCEDAILRHSSLRVHSCLSHLSHCLLPRYPASIASIKKVKTHLKLAEMRSSKHRYDERNGLFTERLRLMSLCLAT